MKQAKLFAPLGAILFVLLTGYIEPYEECIFEILDEPATQELTEESYSIRRSETYIRQMQIALARICTSEGGWSLETWDCRLIFEVLRSRNKDGHLTMSVMRNYSTATFDRRRTDRRRWIPWLNARFEQPQHWDETVTVPWSVHRNAFRQTYEYAGYLIRHEPSYPCTLPVHHWGARGWNVSQREREGWHRIECGAVPTHNQFWMVPRLLEPEERICSLPSRQCEE